ncbi:MAG: glycosyltransferase [Alphaproteobacteria bacterium]
MPAPLVSVLLPARNEAGQIKSALGDLQQQTWRDSEILVIDDGSTDRTADLVREKAADDKRIRIFSQPHQGIVAALNFGLENAQGKFVARMDADDGCAPDRLEKQLHLLQQRPNIHLSSCQVAPPTGERYAGGYATYAAWVNALIEPEQIARERFVECLLVHPTLMLRTDLLRQSAGWREGPFPEDYDLVLRLLAAGYRAAKVPEPLYYWRDHEKRLSRVDARYSPEAFAGLKAQYLSTGPLKGQRQLVIWGAGKVSRRLVRPLQELGHEVVAWIDIDPKKIGRRHAGAPVAPPEKLSQWNHLPLLIYVGRRGARELIRPQLGKHGFAEGENAWFCA